MYRRELFFTQVKLRSFTGCKQEIEALTSHAVTLSGNLEANFSDWQEEDDCIIPDSSILQDDTGYHFVQWRCVWQRLAQVAYSCNSLGSDGIAWKLMLQTLD